MLCFRIALALFGKGCMISCMQNQSPLLNSGLEMLPGHLLNRPVMAGYMGGLLPPWSVSLYHLKSESRRDGFPSFLFFWVLLMKSLPEWGQRVAGEMHLPIDLQTLAYFKSTHWHQVALQSFKPCAVSHCTCCLCSLLKADLSSHLHFQPPRGA